MALLTMRFTSQALRMDTDLSLCVPDSYNIGLKDMHKRKVVTLLHGLSDGGSSVYRFTKLELYCNRTGVVAVMPSVGRSFYCDDINGQDYFRYITKEVPIYLKRLFNISLTREQNYIAGFSMGAVGAARAALSFPENYQKAALYSGPLALEYMLQAITAQQAKDFPFLLSEINELHTSPLNPINLLDKDAHIKPDFIIRAGAEDDCQGMSMAFAKKAAEAGYRVESDFSSGEHNWHTWDPWLEDFISEIGVS